MFSFIMLKQTSNLTRRAGEFKARFSPAAFRSNAASGASTFRGSGQNVDKKNFTKNKKVA
jgi:hypothetical protein